jgi:hypothetical protein
LGTGATCSVYLVQRISDKSMFAAKILSTVNTDHKQFVILFIYVGNICELGQAVKID